MARLQCGSILLGRRLITVVDVFRGTSWCQGGSSLYILSRRIMVIKKWHLWDMERSNMIHEVGLKCIKLMGGLCSVACVASSWKWSMIVQRIPRIHFHSPAFDLRDNAYIKLAFFFTSSFPMINNCSKNWFLFVSF